MMRSKIMMMVDKRRRSVNAKIKPFFSFFYIVVGLSLLFSRDPYVVVQASPETTTGETEATSSSSSDDVDGDPEILVSISDHVIIFSCFKTTKSTASGKSSETETSIEIAACCRGVVEIWDDELHLLPNLDDSIIFDGETMSSVDADGRLENQRQQRQRQQRQRQRQHLQQRRCQRELATVPKNIVIPTVSSLNDDGGDDDADDTMAQYAWTVVVPNLPSPPNNSDSSSSSPSSLKQYWWSPGPKNKDLYDQHHRRPIPKLTELYISQEDNTSTSTSSSIGTMSPYHLPSFMIEETSTSTGHKKLEPISTIESHLGNDGGMHRLWHHSFNITTTTSNDDNKNNDDDDSDDSVSGLCHYLFLTLPSGMFIDLDDPVESGSGGVGVGVGVGEVDNKMTKLSSLGITSSYRVETTTPKTPNTYTYTYDLHLHAAKICDIEQPAFVSGQHLLVWEVCPSANEHTRIGDENEDSNNIIQVDFATKVHLRYPHPTKTMEDYVYLPSPLLFRRTTSSQECLVESDDDGNGDENEYNRRSCATTMGNDSSHDLTTTTMWELGVPTKVWVATGTDEDYPVVVFVTVTACLLGVFVMLRDISKASVWDNV